MRDLPTDVRPREKLLARGPDALSDTELLALLLRTGTRGRHVLQMAHELLAQFGGISGLLQTQAKDLQRFKGLGGTAKRAELLAVLELSRRAIRLSCRVDGMWNSCAPSGDAAEAFRALASITVLVSSSANSGTPSVRERI